MINARNKLCSLAHSHPAYSWSAARQDKENMRGVGGVLQEDKGGLKQKGGRVERQGHVLGKDERSTKGIFQEFIFDELRMKVPGCNQTI